MVNKLFWLLAGTLFLTLNFLLFYRLGIHPIINWDESIYAQVVKEMHASGNWFSFTYFGLPWYEKPPLFLWLLALISSFGGFNEWVLRIPVAIFASLTIALSTYFSWLLSKSKLVAIFTLALFFSSVPFFATSYFIQFDSLLSLLILAQIVAVFFSKKNKNWWYVFGLLLGLSVLTKNVVGLFSLPIVGLVLFKEGRLYAELKAKELWVSVLIFLLVVVPWHIYMSYIAGSAFWDNYLFYHVFRRFSEGIETNGQPWWIFVHALFWYYPINTILFGIGLCGATILSIKKQVWFYPVASCAILLILFSSSSTKLPAYITPVVPFLVICSSLFWGWLLGYLPKYLKYTMALILIAALVFFGVSFNSFKLSKAENSILDLDTKQVGLFLQNMSIQKPIYATWPNYKNLAVGYYSQKKISNQTLSVDQEQQIKNIGTRLLHTSSLQVWETQNSIYIFKK